MGQAFDRDGQVLGEAFGETKREVFDKLNAEFKNAHEIRIKALADKLEPDRREPAVESEIDQLLHDADRKVMGANFARRMGDHVNAAAMDRDAVGLYRQALGADIHMEASAWKETGNRDDEWLRRNGFAHIAASTGTPAPAREIL